MSESLEGMRHKISGVSKLESVVKTMKVLAASNIVQYEQSIQSLHDYTRTIELGLSVYFRKNSVALPFNQGDSKRLYLVVFGSDQGLVGQFNDAIYNFTVDYLKTWQGEISIWAVGERIYSKLVDSGIPVVTLMDVPSTVDGITPLVGEILINCENYIKNDIMSNLVIIYNHLSSGMNYKPVMQRILPIDATWQSELAQLKWPTRMLPEVVGNEAFTLEALIREQIFIAIFKGCAQSLASENASRLASMQRAEKNIEELVDVMGRSIQLLRQKGIDEEIFDVIAGSEDLLENDG
jgi:F-type H+-transporting ATPase subunit gamma